MAITKKNLYGTNSNLNSMSENLDLNRLGDDKSFTTVSFSASPATATIKVGSVIEVNGDAFAIDTADETHLFTSATDNYIGFDGSAFTNWPTKGTWDTAKQGYYQTGGLIRTLKWFVDQTNEEVSIDEEILIAPEYAVNSNVVFRKRVIDIGDWDMSDAGATPSVTLAHGLGANYTKIRQVVAYVRDDGPTVILRPLNRAGEISTITSTSIIVGRDASSIWNSTAWDSTSYNRGWVTIIYEA